MFDSHVHTSFSCDSDMPIENAIDKCQALGVGMVITDHMDINPFRGPEFTFNVEDFFKTYSPLRSETLLLGIEMGLRCEAVQENQDIIKAHDFDFILCSTHAPYDMETNLEYYDKEYYDGLSKKEAYREYFSSMLKGIKENPYFDALAHIDYIARYSPYEDKELYYDQFQPEIDAVLKEVAGMDKALEISTRRLDNPTAEGELVKIYKRFREVGGRYVTIGSDSHGEDAITRHFDKAIAIAEKCDLTPVYFKKRVRQKMIY